MWAKRKEKKSLYSLCCLDSHAKRVARCKLRLSGSCLLTKSMNFEANFKQTLLNRNILWGWLYLARVSIPIINSYCYAVVISRFIAASGFLRFWLYGSDLEKLEKPAVPCLMTAVTLQASSTSGPVPVMSSASQETGGAWVALSAYINITFFFF